MREGYDKPAGWFRWKNYGRNQKKRKEYIQQSGLLLVGVDAGKAKYDACTTQCYFFKNEDVIEGLLIY